MCENVLYIEALKSESLVTGEFYDPENCVLVVLGKNWRKDPQGRITDLSIPSYMSSLAASVLMEFDLAKHVIFSSGFTGDSISEARAMYSAISDSSRLPNDVNIYLEERSFDTHTNVKEVIQVIKDNELVNKTVFLLTIGFHLPRALEIFRLNGIEAVGFSSEEILSYFLPETRYVSGVVEKYLRSPKVILEEFKEVLLWFSLWVDRNGHLSNFITRRTRNVQLDKCRRTKLI